MCLRSRAYFFSVLLLCSACLGNNGPDVIPGDEMVDRIRNAIRRKVAACRLTGFTETTTPDLGFTLTYNQRVFYKTSDLDNCLSIIDAVSCEVLQTRVTGNVTFSQFVVPLFCNGIQPNSLAEPPYFQGNIWENPRL